MLPLLFTSFFQAAVSVTGDLEPALRRIIAASGAEVAVAYRTLDGRASCSSIRTSRFTRPAR